MMHTYTQRGFTLLMSVLISSVLLALGYEIYNLAVKEVTLSSAGRESQFAFFAADTGIECALYADTALDAFATSSTITEITCGALPSVLTRTDDGTDFVTTFSFTSGAGNSAQCVDVVVTRRDPKRTIIESYGHNTCSLTDPLRLERAIRVTY
jgi:Tfp pilus assembly protein PilX